MADGIPLYGLPPASIAEALIRAKGARERREILGRRWKPISADCRAVVGAWGSDAAALYVRYAVAALDALDAGHTEAAQALAGSLIDAILTSYFGVAAEGHRHLVTVGDKELLERLSHRSERDELANAEFAIGILGALPVPIGGVVLAILPGPQLTGPQ